MIGKSHRTAIRPAVLLGLTVLLSACGSAPTRAPQYETGAEATVTPSRATAPGVQAVRVADAQLGAPYRYGGAGPSGFDCSGLVQYSYRAAGVNVPRTTGQQLQHARPVALSKLQPGDLLFFRLSGKPSHVGIYAGDGRFIHAPSSGKQVSYARLNNPYWRKRIVAAGRVY